MNKNLFFAALLLHAMMSQAQVNFVPTGGTAVNLYGSSVANKHTLAYDPTSGLLLFGHRGGGDGGTTSGNSFVFDYSNDGGQTWVPQIQIANPLATEMIRYPQAAILNSSTGNKVIFTGPAYSPISTSWSKTYLGWADVNAPTNGNYSFEGYKTQNDTVPYIDFGSWDLCNLNGGLGYVAAHLDSASVAVNMHNIDFYKITPDSTGFTRRMTFSTSLLTCAMAGSAASFGYSMGFDPSGDIGYIAHTTADMDADPRDYSHVATLYKTTDAGESWVKLPMLNMNRIQTLIDSTAQALAPSSMQSMAPFVRPIMSNLRVVVDNAGKCHIFSEISSGLTIAQDSLAMLNPDPSTKYLMHFITEDGINYQSNFITRLYDVPGTIATVQLALTNELQAGRSADGNYIFFTCVQSNRVLGGYNDSPDLYVYAYDVVNNSFMPLTNMTVGTDAAHGVFFPRLSPIVRDVPNGHNLPIMIMLNDIVNNTDPVSFIFLKGINVPSTAYTQPMPAPVAANVSDPSQCGSTGVFNSYFFILNVDNQPLADFVTLNPNPTSGLIHVDLSKRSSASTIVVSDLLGRNIQTLTNQNYRAEIDISQQTEGVYLITIDNLEGRMTTKVVVVR